MVGEEGQSRGSVKIVDERRRRLSIDLWSVKFRVYQEQADKMKRVCKYIEKCKNH